MKRAFGSRAVWVAGVLVGLAQAALAQEPASLADGSPGAFLDWTGQFVLVTVEAPAPSSEEVAKEVKRKYRQSEEDYLAQVEEERLRRVRRSAVMMAREKALPLILSMRLDSQKTVADLEIADPAAVLSSEEMPYSFERSAWHDRLDEASLEVVVKFPLWDGTDHSLGAVLLKFVRASVPDPPEEVRALMGKRRRFREGEEIIFDARSVGAEPALFPEVRTTSGKVVYNVRALARKTLLSRGVASHAVLDEKAVLSSDRRRGVPLVTVIPVRAVGKERPATLIISDADAKAILAEARKTALLVAGRVRVILREQ